MRMEGCKEVMGSWKTMATSLPLISDQSAGVMLEMERPNRFAVLAWTSAFGSNNPMDNNAPTDLPEPLSPTTAKLWPG